MSKSINQLLLENNLTLLAFIISILVEVSSKIVTQAYYIAEYIKALKDYYVIFINNNYRINYSIH